MDTTENKELVRRLFEEGWNEQRLEIIDEFIASPLLAGSLRGGIQGSHSATPDLHVTIEDLLGEEDKVLAQWTARGTHTGTMRAPLEALPPSGQRVEWTGMTLFKLRGGKVITLWQNWDLYEMLQQLGALPGIGGSTAE
jgi:steroid delta-isomerase-like uncharacterized protein